MQNMNNERMRVEYLVIIENENIKCTDSISFNHFLQTDPDITIVKNKLNYKNIPFDFLVESGNVNNTDKTYFHITISSKVENVEEFSKILKAIRSSLHVASKKPQTLYDGLSLHYAHLAYPLIFEVENLMRKLITKFMIVNVGVNAMDERMPADVKNTINQANQDLTYLHNIDFNQLKHFLFSENYPSHKDALIQKLRTAKNISEIELEDIKSLVPISNWEKYFEDTVEITKENLCKQWDDLYLLRCNIAHNKVFSNADYNEVKRLSASLKAVILKAIAKLDKIEVNESDREILSVNINSNYIYYPIHLIASMSVLEHHLDRLYREICISKGRIDIVDYTPLDKNVIPNMLFEEGMINNETLENIYYLNRINISNASQFSQIEINRTMKLLADCIKQVQSIAKERPRIEKIE